MRYRIERVLHPRVQRRHSTAWIESVAGPGFTPPPYSAAMWPAIHGHKGRALDRRRLAAKDRRFAPRGGRHSTDWIGFIAGSGTIPGGPQFYVPIGAHRGRRISERHLARQQRLATARGAQHTNVAQLTTPLGLPPGPGPFLVGFFYPSILGGNYGLNFTEPATTLKPTPGVQRGQNISWAGFTETLSARVNEAITLEFRTLTTFHVEHLEAWFTGWAARGGISTLVLDRFDTCAGQWEYDRYNRFFTRACLVTNPFESLRLTPAGHHGTQGPRYTMTLQFRQDEDVLQVA